MNKIFMISLWMLLSASVFADANVNVKNAGSSFLLTAPGTLSGSKQGMPTQDSATEFGLPGTTEQPPQRYKYVGESSKFRQFGQKSGDNNPWFEDDYDSRSKRPHPMNMRPMTNPWQIGSGMPSAPPRGPAGYGPGAYSADPYSSYNQPMYSNDSHLYPDFPDGIYRDTNPATFSRPMNNGFMPGMGGDNFGFPFPPFDMF